MDRKEELIQEANRRFKEDQKIVPLEGNYKDWDGDVRNRSDAHYKFYPPRVNFHYDPEEDTLCNWGMGIGLIYRKGEWAGDQTTDKNYFPKGTYVVLLAGCDGGDTWHSIPINHVYKLREASNSTKLIIEKDVNGSTSNGWSTITLNYESKLVLRKATPEEITAYENGIMNISQLQLNYQIF